MKPGFECSIVGAQIQAELCVPTALQQVVLCFSLMAPFRVISGGTLIKSLGGYGEIAVGDLVAGAAVSLVLEHSIERHRPANRAWLPLGAYLRHSGGLLALPAGPSGASVWQAEDGIALPDLRLGPTPKTTQLAGEKVSIKGFSCDDIQFKSVDDLAHRSGLGAFLGADGIKVHIEQRRSLKKDHYEIEIGADRVLVTAGEAGGKFYAAITLLHLLHTHAGELPIGNISDGPALGWRGMHLDCARHYFEPQTLFDYVDLLALMKMNRFHWHFADDEAFRLELETLPELWQKTRMRGEGYALPGLFGGGIEAGGSYDLAFVRSLIAHAKSLHIEIMPELEFPAHALAMNAAIDGMRDPADNGAEVSVQGYVQNSLNPAMPRTWEITHRILSEIARIFPFDYIHLGCDELPENTWSGSPAAAKLMNAEGLDTTDDLQGWMMERLGAFVVGLGKKPAAWEEAARGKNGGIGHGALLFSWTGQSAGIAAAQRGYDVVMCPAQHTYLDMARTDDPADWGANWAAILPLENTVNWSPAPEGIRAYSGQILGVEGCFWGEFTTQDFELGNMIWPRILGIAQSGWTANLPVEERTNITAIGASYQNTGFAKVLRRGKGQGRSKSVAQ